MAVLCSHLHAGLDLLVLVHDGQDGLHAAVFYQVRLVPHQDQRNPVGGEPQDGTQRLLGLSLPKKHDKALHYRDLYSGNAETEPNAALVR